MFNLDDIKKDNNKDWKPYRKLVIGPPEIRKNKLFIVQSSKRQKYNRQNLFVCQRFRRTQV